ncbi:hypothetical protein D3C71_1933150 [compost metagenome]
MPRLKRFPASANTSAAAPPSNFRTAKTIPNSVGSNASALPYRSRNAHKPIWPVPNRKKKNRAAYATDGKLKLAARVRAWFFTAELPK